MFQMLHSRVCPTHQVRLGRGAKAGRRAGAKRQQHISPKVITISNYRQLSLRSACRTLIAVGLSSAMTNNATSTAASLPTAAPHSSSCCCDFSPLVLQLAIPAHARRTIILDRGRDLEEDTEEVSLGQTEAAKYYLTGEEQYTKHDSLSVLIPPPPPSPQTNLFRKSLSSKKYELTFGSSLSGSSGHKSQGDTSRLNILNMELEARLSQKQDELDKAMNEIEVSKQENQALLQSLKEKQNNVAANHESNINTTIPIDLAANFLPNSVVQYVSTGETLTKVRQRGERIDS